MKKWKKCILQANIWKVIYLRVRRRKVWGHDCSSQLYTQLKQLYHLKSKKKFRPKRDFFRLQFHICLNCVYNCDDQTCLQNMCCKIVMWILWLPETFLFALFYNLLYLPANLNNLVSFSIHLHSIQQQKQTNKQTNKQEQREQQELIDLQKKNCF